MAKCKRGIGQEILDGIREIKRGDHGHVTVVPRVSAIREAAGLSQAQMAQLMAVSVRTLQAWEQGRRAPSGAARTLLLVAAKNPRLLLVIAQKEWSEPASTARTVAELKSALKKSRKEEVAGKGRRFKTGREAIRWLES